MDIDSAKLNAMLKDEQSVIGCGLEHLGIVLLLGEFWSRELIKLTQDLGLHLF